MAVQDDAREIELRDLFELQQDDDRKRADLDAYLDLPDRRIGFELKSSTNKSVSTVRDLGPKHIKKWAPLHWIFGFYQKDGQTLRYCYYASPADMADWIREKEQYVSPDFVLAKCAGSRLTDDDLTLVVGPDTAFPFEVAKRIMKAQWSTEEYARKADLTGGRFSRAAMLELLRARAGYIIRRGATLNNPHIQESYLAERVKPIFKDHAATARTLIQAYLAKRSEQLAAGIVPREDQIDPIIVDQEIASETDEAKE